MKALEKDINWYNENFYNSIDFKKFPAWYRFALELVNSYLDSSLKLVELGCGHSAGLRYLYCTEKVKKTNIYGLDQSTNAIANLEREMPEAHLKNGDIYSTDYEEGFFDLVFLMETIEHLRSPVDALEEINRIMKESGLLVLSFPNYINLPWLLVRILSEKLNRPSWICLQPVDSIFTFFGLKKLVEAHGFILVESLGTTYFPPVFWQYEKRSYTRFLNKLKLAPLSFHPVLVFKKIEC